MTPRWTSLQSVWPRLRGMGGMTQGEVSNPWLNAAEAASYLACSRDRVYDLVQLGKLEASRDGRRLLFRRADLDGYLRV